MKIVTKNYQTVQCDVLTDIGHLIEDSIGQNLEDSNGHGDKKQLILQCELLTDIAQILGNSKCNIDTNLTDAAG
jgi:hypothetical protein